LNFRFTEFYEVEMQDGAYSQAYRIFLYIHLATTLVTVVAKLLGKGFPAVGRRKERLRGASW
jgi:hypothetical protein